MNEERKMLRKVAEQLDRWAIESQSGGWSTHQVEPMRKTALEIYAYLGRTEGYIGWAPKEGHCDY